VSTVKLYIESVFQVNDTFFFSVRIPTRSVQLRFLDARVLVVVPHFHHRRYGSQTKRQQQQPKSNSMNAVMDNHLDTMTSTELVTMDNIPNDIMINQILPFIGDGHYQYIGLVNRNFRQTYTTLYPTKTTYCNGSTIAHARFCCQTTANYLQRIQGYRYLCLSAARYGSIEVLTYVLREDKDWWGEILEKAIQYGHLHVLQWLIRKEPEKKKHAGPISCIAAQYGQLGILQWINEQWVNELDCYIWKHPFVCEYAARGGHWDVLEYAANNGCGWDEDTCKYIAQHGNLEVLKWARTNGNVCPWDERTCASAAENCHIETLKWAIANGCPCDTDVCAILAKGGDLETLKWVRRNDCPWDERTCTLAAQFGHTETWKWALTNGCPCNARTCAIFAGNGDLESLKYK
jgi:hypothetical protein